MCTSIQTLQKKIEAIKKKFLSLSSLEKRYGALMEMGKKMAPFADALKIPENRVSGCQSNLYLSTKVENGLIYFEAHSDALISAGLAALLIAVYNGETPETILKESPDFLQELEIYALLSPNRSNGLSAIYLRMKQEALKVLVKSR